MSRWVGTKSKKPGSSFPENRALLSKIGLNSYHKVVCERVFWERDSKAQQPSPLSLESQRPLSHFAVLSFSITYELDYFNVVNILKTSGIPLYAADRDERHPLVFAWYPIAEEHKNQYPDGISLPLCASQIVTPLLY